METFLKASSIPTLNRGKMINGSEVLEQKINPYHVIVTTSSLLVNDIAAIHRLRQGKASSLALIDGLSENCRNLAEMLSASLLKVADNDKLTGPARATALLSLRYLQYFDEGHYTCVMKAYDKLLDAAKKTGYEHPKSVRSDMLKD